MTLGHEPIVVTIHAKDHPRRTLLRWSGRAATYNEAGPQALAALEAVTDAVRHATGAEIATGERGIRYGRERRDAKGGLGDNDADWRIGKTLQDEIWRAFGESDAAARPILDHDLVQRLANLAARSDARVDVEGRAKGQAEPALIVSRHDWTGSLAFTASGANWAQASGNRASFWNPPSPADRVRPGWATIEAVMAVAITLWVARGAQKMRGASLMASAHCPKSATLAAARQANAAAARAHEGAEAVAGLRSLGLTGAAQRLERQLAGA